ncbi:MAG TPA: ATP synthase F1 subunit delta [Candidatus Aveggerthella stercoripullorum]|uniref:ATP synthase subunit delta n=1 Tax=Candidatus Aveggerthella stercoripullorum TaxID=2840688 RepID=A0A9D0ZY59_9ACTN|nr:ATP synthase F1 subunit delta [Candidatus Aveggerthella stercoripullorum]
MPTNRLVVKETVDTYASVLLDAANAAGGQDAVLEVRDQLEVVTKALRSNVDLEVALAEEAYTPEQRETLVRNVFAGMNPALAETLLVMAERDDLGLAGRIYRAYDEQIEEKLGVAVVDVTTVVELDDALRETISNKAAQDLGKQVVLREHVDKSILGGIIMSVSGRRIDASIATQLDTARTVLKTTDGGEC